MPTVTPSGPITDVTTSFYGFASNVVYNRVLTNAMVCPLTLVFILNVAAVTLMRVLL